MPSQHRPIPATIRPLFGKPPILVGENPADYEQLMEMVRADVNPQELREWLLLKDIVDAEWDLLRLRGLKEGMLHAMMPRAFNSRMADADAMAAAGVEQKWVPALRRHVMGLLAGDEQAKRDLQALLDEHTLTLDIVTASAFAQTIVPQLHADRMASAAYDRRNAAYAELERLRAKG